MTTYVIVGGGLAGAKTAEHLREHDEDSRVVLVGAEQELPYERPGLSKGYFAGGESVEDLQVQPATWYSDNQIELRLGTFVDAIDPAQQTVTLGDGTTIGYDALALATGSSPRSLPLPGTHRPGVHTFRTLADSDALRTAVPGKKLIIIGAGWIGLEVAASARGLDADVTLLEAGPQVLSVLGPEIGADFAALHRSHGVEIITDAKVAGIDGDGANGSVTGVTLDDGTTIPADLVLIAVGAAPRTELAEGAGLDIDAETHGVSVETSLRTSDPNIVAVGDISSVEQPGGGRVRVEHWATALNQPKVAAATMVGQVAQYLDRPYFFTDQYDLGMEFRGTIPDSSTLVRRGDDAEYLAIWLDAHNVPRAVMNVNIWDAGDDIEALLDRGEAVDPSKLADPQVALADV